jgi:hypothetical protein
VADLWERVVNTTIAKYIREVEVNVLRNRKLLALLKSKGRITFGHSGQNLDWKVRYKRAPMQGYADMDTLTFSRRERWKTATLDWRGYAATDSMTKKERLMNKNVEAIVKVYSEIAANLMEDMEDQFGDELYIDGNASGNSKRIHGLESFLAGTGSGASAGYVEPPSDTYAGLSTVLGNYGGSWSVNGSSQVEWPSGYGDAHYDFWSPLIVDYTDSAWAATTDTWVNTCREAIRYGVIKGRRNKSKRGMLDLILLDNELFRLLEEKIEGNERVVVNRGEKSALVSLGFNDTVNFEGIDITYEYGVPANVGYGLCTECMELCSLQDTLFAPFGPDFDIATQSHRFSIDFFGNLKIGSPRNFVKWKATS